MSLDDILNKRKQSSKWPGIWRPSKVGDKVQGQITRIRRNPFDEERNSYEIHDFITNKIYTLPSHRILIRILEESKVKVGDIVMIEYVGTQKSKRGKDAFTYEYAILESEIFEKLLQEGKVSRPKTPPTYAESEKDKTIQESNQPQPQKTSLDELKKYVSDLSEFYDEMAIGDFDNYINKIRAFNVPVQEAIRICGLKVVEDKVKFK